MGKSYWFECGRCGYRAKVAGRADDGLHVSVQTILCEDCKELYDAITRLRILEGSQPALHGKLGNARENIQPAGKPAPGSEGALNRLRFLGERVSDWLKFPLKCPISLIHRVRVWNDPDKCPRCGVYLERAALAYRIWD
jgi:ribosomal protein S27AE